jgi:hypothetical protein
MTRDELIAEIMPVFGELGGPTRKRVEIGLIALSGIFLDATRSEEHMKDGVPDIGDNIGVIVAAHEFADRLAEGSAQRLKNFGGQVG